MRIILVGHGHGDTMTFTREDVGSGWENLCPELDGRWYSLDDAWDIEADAVLYIGTHQSVRALAARGKPPKWRRCVLLQEAGASALNDVGYALDVFAVGFDAIFAYSLLERFALFGKPVFEIVNGYPFHKHPDLRGVAREDKVMLYLTQYRDPAADMLGTLAMFRRLNARGVTYVDDPAPLAVIAAAAGLAIDVRASVPWPEFLAELATCKVAASMDSRQTWGRLDLDCALVGIRCVGPFTANKARLFPDCIADTIEDCSARAQREIDGDPHYSLADDTVRMFDAAAVVADMRTTLERIAA